MPTHFEPTLKLRWYILANGEQILQQLWRCDITETSEWRNVLVERGQQNYSFGVIMAEHKPIPKGWYFYSADFSIEGTKGRILLSRDTEGKAWWHTLDEAGQQNISLYISGYGCNVNEAIDNAIGFIPQEQPE